VDLCSSGCPLAASGSGLGVMRHRSCIGMVRVPPKISQEKLPPRRWQVVLSHALDFTLRGGVLQAPSKSYQGSGGSALLRSAGWVRLAVGSVCINISATFRHPLAVDADWARETGKSQLTNDPGPGYRIGVGLFSVPAPPTRFIVSGGVFSWPDFPTWEKWSSLPPSIFSAADSLQTTFLQGVELVNLTS